jgi:hypothetical protein
MDFLQTSPGLNTWVAFFILSLFFKIIGFPKKNTTQTGRLLFPIVSLRILLLAKFVNGYIQVKLTALT